MEPVAGAHLDQHALGARVRLGGDGLVGAGIEGLVHARDPLRAVPAQQVERLAVDHPHALPALARRERAVEVVDHLQHVAQHRLGVKRLRPLRLVPDAADAALGLLQGQARPLHERGVARLHLAQPREQPRRQRAAHHRQHPAESREHRHPDPLCQPAPGHHAPRAGGLCQRVTTPADPPPLESCGFVRVPGDPPLWLKCESCGKSDHFWLDGGVRCRCGARYAHAVRPDGAQVPAAQLAFVPFEKGPPALRDLELDPRRVAVLIAFVVTLVAALGFWLLRG